MYNNLLKYTLYLLFFVPTLYTAPFCSDNASTTTSMKNHKQGLGRITSTKKNKIITIISVGILLIGSGIGIKYYYSQPEEQHPQQTQTEETQLEEQQTVQTQTGETSQVQHAQNNKLSDSLVYVPCHGKDCNNLVNIAGMHNKHFTVHYHLEESVATFKKRIEHKGGGTWDKQQLVISHTNKELDDNEKPLKHYGIDSLDRINCTVP